MYPTRLQTHRDGPLPRPRRRLMHALRAELPPREQVHQRRPAARKFIIFTTTRYKLRELSEPLTGCVNLLSYRLQLV